MFVYLYLQNKHTMAAQIQYVASLVVEAATAAALQTALNTALENLADLNPAPDGGTQAANIISVNYGTTITTADVINLTVVVIYSYYADAV